MRRGAAIAQMEEFVGYQHTIPPGSENSDIKPPAQSMTAKPHAILVDQSGVRYMNEGGSYMAYCKAMFERHKTVPAVPSWAILDSQYLRRYMLAGTMPGSKKPQRWYDEGYLRKGDTIEELAAQLNMKPADASGNDRSLQRLRRQGQGRGFRPRLARLRSLARRPLSQALGNTREHLRRALLRRPRGAGRCRDLWRGRYG